MAILIPARNVPNAQTVTLVINAFCNKYGYQDTIEGVANSQTKAQFALQQVDKFIINVVKEDQARIAIDPVRSQAIAAVDSQVVIT